MNAFYHLENNTHILTLEAKDECEGDILNKFAQQGETFTGEMRHDPGYKHPHIILRKETT